MAGYVGDSVYYDNNDSYHRDNVPLTMLLPPDDAANFSGNASYHGNQTAMTGMMDWKMRFVSYTVIAAAGFTFNVLSLMALNQIHGHRSVHHVLLQNLAVCDMVGSVLLWMYYNSPVLFPKFPIERMEHCMFIALVLVAPVLLSLCTSCLSLLLLALNQYLAICNPLFSATRISRGTACCCIVASWILAAGISTVPAFLMLFMTQFRDCAPTAVSIGEKSIEIGAYVLTALIVLIVALYGRIYREVLEYRKRMPQLHTRPSCHAVRTGDAVTVGRRTDTEHNFKAFITTFLLSGTLLLFWLPYMIFNFISAHINFDLIPDMVLYIKFYFMDFLPMLNFMTDPIIYGIRMREIRAGYKRMFAKVFPCCVKEPRRPFTRNSVRFTSLDSTTL